MKLYTHSLQFKQNSNDFPRNKIRSPSWQTKSLYLYLTIPRQLLFFWNALKQVWFLAFLLCWYQLFWQDVRRFRLRRAWYLIRLQAVTAVSRNWMCIKQIMLIGTNNHNLRRAFKKYLPLITKRAPLTQQWSSVFVFHLEGMWNEARANKITV